MVTFMWMLMEGVVLYVVLVKVFVKNKEKKYMVAFTILSYGKMYEHCSCYTIDYRPSRDMFYVLSCKSPLHDAKVCLHCTWH